MTNVILFIALNKQSCKQAWSLVFFIFFVSKGYRSEAIGYVIAELLASGALWLRKFGYDVAYDLPSVQTLGEGKGSQTSARRGRSML